MYYAHSTDDDSQQDWHSLRQHLTETGHMAAKSAAKFGAQKAARLAGLLHDLVKYTPAFQAGSPVLQKRSIMQPPAQKKSERSKARARIAL
ncbi:hypothetical protein [Paremcibacter congregatus]|uniref:hypothetical protein n=1 Tax=Paremcibacter congregatus TaxID=2043170 RepID=UPI0030EDBBD5|tara:strand:- start:190 stop:462 length:273 start_codon:yes stop_codon:yes gene_type:complete